MPTMPHILLHPFMTSPWLFLTGLNLLEQAQRNRHTGPTGQNHQSSRGHLRITLSVIHPNGDKSTVQVYDLAGNEDNRRTGNSENP